jgi:L-ascorbate metabolism protein UlaG (beta-lactamase superfamily)
LKKPLAVCLLIVGIGFVLSACAGDPPVSTSIPMPTLTSTIIPTPTKTALPGSFVAVTFYDLSGFLVQIGDKKILIDALFGSFPRYEPPREAFDRVTAGEPPFDDIDLVLVTHNHPDHFSADEVGAFLQNHPETALVSSVQVVREVNANHPELVNPIYSVNISAGEQETITLDGIEVVCLNISHGMPDVLNLGFVVTVGQITLFHSGDINPEDVSVDDLIAYQLPEKQLDLAFIPISLLTVEVYHPYILEGIQAKYLVPTHYPYQDPRSSIDYFPDAVLFSDTLESWQMP